MSIEKSQIQVDSVEAVDEVSPVTLSFGGTCISGSNFSSAGGVSISGVITAGSYSGSASGLTGIGVAQTGHIIGTILIR